MGCEIHALHELLILRVQLDERRPEAQLGEFLGVSGNDLESGEPHEDLELSCLVEERDLGDPAELDRVAGGAREEPLELVSLDDGLRALEERVLGPSDCLQGECPESEGEVGLCSVRGEQENVLGERVQPRPALICPKLDFAGRSEQ